MYWDKIGCLLVWNYRLKKHFENVKHTQIMFKMTSFFFKSKFQKALQSSTQHILFYYWKGSLRHACSSERFGIYTGCVSDTALSVLTLLILSKGMAFSRKPEKLLFNTFIIEAIGAARSYCNTDQLQGEFPV